MRQRVALEIIDGPLVAQVLVATNNDVDAQDKNVFAFKEIAIL